MSAARHMMNRLARSMAFLGLLAWALGSAYTVAHELPGLFQRFGALGVAASVLFFTDRLLKIELSRQRSVEKLLHEYGLELEVLKSGTDAKEIPSTGYAVDFLTEERNFDALRQQADAFNVANIALITVATLQWGFGDFFLMRIMAGDAP